MTTAASSTANVNLLRRLFGNEMADLTFGDDPYLRGVKKLTTGFGEIRYVVVRIGQTAGVGGSIVEAIANQSPTAERRFSVTERTIYAVFTMKGAFLRKARGKPNSLLTGYESQARSAMYDFRKILENQSWAAGGRVGTINATVTGTTLTFGNARALIGINLLNKWLTFASDDGTAASPAGERGTGGVPFRVQVTAVDIGNNRVTVSPSLTTVTGLTSGDSVHIDGFYARAMMGKQGWNPITAPGGSDSFFGVNRSEAVEPLSGWRVTGSGLYESTLIDALTYGEQATVDTRTAFVNKQDWASAVKEMGVQAFREPGGKKTGGAKALAVDGPDGTCFLTGVNRVPKGYAWLGDPSNDVLLSEGEIPQILNEDKVGPMRMLPTDDAYQSRLGGDANFIPDDSAAKLGPGAWVVVSW